jgi:hypothetical protein
MEKPSGDCFHTVAKADNVNRSKAIGVCSVAKLTRMVPAPALYPTATDQGTGVSKTYGDGIDPSGKPAYVGRSSPVDGGSVA